MNDKKTPHTKAELIDIFVQKGVEKNFYPRFSDYYNYSFEELFSDMKDFEDDDFEEGDSIQASALWCTNRYIDKFQQLIDNGHSEEWAHLLADTAEDGEKAIFLAYSELRDIDKDLANKELKTYCKSLGSDEYFEKYYMFLFEEVSPVTGRIDTAKKYSAIYKDQLSVGKSEVYSHEYADLIAEGNCHEIYCEEYAYAFDKANNEGKDIQYKRLFADKYATALTDIKRRYGVSDDEEQIDYAIEKVTAYMKGWEYAEENITDKKALFIEIYQDVYLNTLYGEITLYEEKLEDYILDKVLKTYSATKTN